MAPVTETDASLTVRDARDRHLAASGYDTSGYDAPVFWVKLGPLPLPFPNPGVLHLHDLHHVVTGYATDLIGEAEISVFELRAGCRTWVVHLLCFGAIFFAAFIAPRRLLRAWRRSRGLRSLYYDDMAYQELLDLQVGALRERLGMPRQGLSGH